MYYFYINCLQGCCWRSAEEGEEEGVEEALQLFTDECSVSLVLQ